MVILLEPATISAIQAETARAQTIHGSIPSPDRGMVILMEEVGEAAEQILELGRPDRSPRGLKDNRDDAIKELIQVASVALRMVEQLEHNQWPTKS